MKVLAILGTNRRNGIVEKLCQSVLNGAKEQGFETEIINLYDYDFKYCNGCWACVSNEKCILVDDFERIFQKLKKADIIILGVPCYWGNVPGIVKTFFDRHTGYAMFKPKNASEFSQMDLTRKIMEMFKALKLFGAQTGIAGKKFWLISAMTLPLPKALITGDYRGLVCSAKIYSKKLKCKSFNKFVFTDSLFRFQKNKEERYLIKAQQIGRRLK